VAVFTIILFALLVFQVRRSNLSAPTAAPPSPPPVTPIYNIMSEASKMQTQIDELTKQHIIKIQTLTDPAAITSENTTYADQVKKIRADYEAKITTPL